MSPVRSFVLVAVSVLAVTDLTAQVAARSYLDGGVTPGATVYYQVAAIYPDGNRGLSGLVVYLARRSTATYSEGSRLSRPGTTTSPGTVKLAFGAGRFRVLFQGREARARW